MAMFPPIEPFDSSKDEWNSWSRRFDQWLKISPYAEGEGETTTNKRCSAFCTCIGSEAFKLLCSLRVLKKPKECTYETLKAKMERNMASKHWY